MKQDQNKGLHDRKLWVHVDNTPKIQFGSGLMSENLYGFDLKK